MSGVNLYRLKQVDLDGKFIYSAIVKVIMEAGPGRFSIIQNSVQSSLQLSLQLPLAQKITLQVRDMSGHLLSSEERPASKGISIQSLSVSNLSRETYIIQITSQSINGTKTFIRQ